MKAMMLTLGLLVAATGTANAQSVEVGVGDWSAVPVIQPQGNLRMTGKIVERLHKLAGEVDCDVAGFDRRRIDLSVPFVIRFTPEGAVERIVLRDLKCPQLETMMGAVVLQMAQGGEYRPGSNPTRWYRSELSFTSR